jgi:TPR repeat protein
MNIVELQQKAESGSIVDQAVLGLCYLYGHDVEVNYAEAFRWLNSAKDKGASRAVVNLAYMYAEGLGIPKNSSIAIRFYEAVAKVEPRAQLELGRMYAKGIGIQPDSRRALTYYSAIADRKDGTDDQTTAAFIGALTLAEIQEAKDFVATHR